MLGNEAIPGRSNSYTKTGGEIEKEMTKKVSPIPVGWLAKTIPESKLGNGGGMFTNLYLISQGNY